MTFEKIKDRYLKNYITDAQLERFVMLGVITHGQYNALYNERHPELHETESDEI